MSRGSNAILCPFPDVVVYDPDSPAAPALELSPAGLAGESLLSASASSPTAPAPPGPLFLNPDEAIVYKCFAVGVGIFRSIIWFDL